MAVVEHTALTTRTLNEGLNEIERRVEAKLLTQRNVHTAEIRQIGAMVQEALGNLSRHAAQLEVRVALLENQVKLLNRSPWQKLRDWFRDTFKPVG